MDMSGFDEIDDEMMDEAMDECITAMCKCVCHDDLYHEFGWTIEAGTLSMDEASEGPYQREGVFPFLTLPGEIRDRIYNFAFIQSGERRVGSTHHRGEIHTALLGTCRQVYNEARHLPLTLNKLCFSAPLDAVDFIGFFLAPTQRELVTAMHIEFYYPEFSNSSWRLLLREMVKLPLTHLGLTIKGGYPKEALQGHECFADRFKPLKGIKTMDVVLASGLISDKAKRAIVEELKENIITGYVRPKESKKGKKPRRAVFIESEGSSQVPVKKTKKTNKHVSGQTALYASVGTQPFFQAAASIDTRPKTWFPI